jgi:sRNA-binding regulator protein Hfq
MTLTIVNIKVLLFLSNTFFYTHTVPNFDKFEINLLDA